MPLVKDGRIAADIWTTLSDDDPLPEIGAVVVSLARFRAERDALLARGGPLGVRLKSNELAPELGDDARSLALVAIEFPTFRDGRGYSTARLLRERFGFAGELRAVGNVLRDQFLFMQRCGFDAYEVKDEEAARQFAAALDEFSVVYQPATDARIPVTRLRQQRREAAE